MGWFNSRWGKTLLDISWKTQNVLQVSLVSRKNSLALAIGLLKKLATLTKILGVWFIPKFFWKNTKTMFYRIFIVTNLFVLYANFTPVHMNFKREPQIKRFIWCQILIIWKRGNIERENSDLLLLVRYNVSFCLLSVQKHKIRLKNGLFYQKLEWQENSSY